MANVDGITSLQTVLSSLPVNGTKQVAATRASESVSDETQTAVKSAASSVHRSDQASLSTAGGLAAEAASGSDVRSEKVAALQQAIASGTYNVPAHAVADKIIEHLLG